MAILPVKPTFVRILLFVLVVDLFAMPSTVSTVALDKGSVNEPAVVNFVNFERRALPIGGGGGGATTDDPTTKAGPPPTTAQPTPTQQPTAQPTTDTPTAAPPPSKADPTTDPRPATSARSVVTLTSTSTIPNSLLNAPTLPPIGAAQQNQNNTNNNNGGGGGGGVSGANAVTAGIVLGSVVVAAAIGIWIFRKWKLSPSRNFKEKIQPVDFAPRSHESDTVFLRQLHEP